MGMLTASLPIFRTGQQRGSRHPATKRSKNGQGAKGARTQILLAAGRRERPAGRAEYVVSRIDLRGSIDGDGDGQQYRIDLKHSLRLDLARISCDAILYILYRSDIIS